VRARAPLLGPSEEHLPTLRGTGDPPTEGFAGDGVCANNFTTGVPVAGVPGDFLGVLDGEGVTDALAKGQAPGLAVGGADGDGEYLAVLA